MVLGKYFITIMVVILVILLTMDFQLPTSIVSTQIGLETLVWFEHYKKKRSAVVGFNISLNQGYYSFYKKPNGKLHSTLVAALEAKSDANKTVVVSLVDVGFIDMAVNLYEASFLPFNISNYLFLCSSKVACQILVDMSDLTESHTIRIIWQKILNAW